MILKISLNIFLNSQSLSVRYGSRAVLGARDAEASRMESPCLQEASGPVEESRPYM